MTQPSQAMSLSSFPTATKLTIVGLLAAAVGIVLQYLAYPEDFPTVPPGPIIVTAAAVFVTLGVRWWWSSLVGVGVSLMILIGGIFNGIADNLTEFSGPAIGAAVMLIGFVTAIVAGTMAAASRCRPAH